MCCRPSRKHFIRWTRWSSSVGTDGPQMLQHMDSICWNIWSPYDPTVYVQRFYYAILYRDMWSPYVSTVALHMLQHMDSNCSSICTQELATYGVHILQSGAIWTHMCIHLFILSLSDHHLHVYVYLNLLSKKGTPYIEVVVSILL